MSLSLGNPAGVVLESNGAMLVLVELEGYLETHVIVTVETCPGSGKLCEGFRIYMLFIHVCRIDSPVYT